MKSEIVQSINETIFEQFPTLESERLIFRQYQKDDGEQLLNIRSHPKVAKFMDSKLLESVEDAEKRIVNIQESFKNKEGITWAIINKKTSALIGDFGIWRIDKQNFRGEIGYILSPDFWGKGYMKESMMSLISFAFNSMNLHSLEANVNPKNENSKNLLIRMNFKLEAYFRENYYFDGKFLDSEIYCLLKSDLPQKS